MERELTAGPGARELVENLLGTLSPRDRSLLTMLDLEGRTIAYGYTF